MGRRSTVAVGLALADAVLLVVTGAAGEATAPTTLVLRGNFPEARVSLAIPGAR
jgi:hypothetical protein